jgi:hypothetical protein
LSAISNKTTSPDSQATAKTAPDGEKATEFAADRAFVQPLASNFGWFFF